jgi:hypothetical protein
VVHEVGPTLGPSSILTRFTKLGFDSRTKLQQLGFSRNTSILLMPIQMFEA